MEYVSYTVADSKLAAGVKYTIAKMSFGRRVDLTRQIRELAGRREFLDAGGSPADKMDAALLTSEIDRIYLLWGLKEVTGLEVDGQPATPESFAGAGPEDLFREALAAIKQQCGLSEAERKLIAALHFQFSNQAGWECGKCRESGLEMKRRCGWIPAASELPTKVVWAKDGAGTYMCPKSFVTAQSMAWVEFYLVRRKLGQKGIDGLEARDVEAFLILEHELGEREGRQRGR